MSLLTNRAQEKRPWGSFERFTHGEASTVKLLTVLPGQRFSLQYHRKRSEFWRIVSGEGVATIGSDERAAKVGDEFEILAGTPHRLAGGPYGIIALEIALGDFDEGDIVRLEDDYGRAPEGAREAT